MHPPVPTSHRRCRGFVDAPCHPVSPSHATAPAVLSRTTMLASTRLGPPSRRRARSSRALVSSSATIPIFAARSPIVRVDPPRANPSFEQRRGAFRPPTLTASDTYASWARRASASGRSWGAQSWRWRPSRSRRRDRRPWWRSDWTDRRHRPAHCAQLRGDGVAVLGRRGAINAQRSQNPPSRTLRRPSPTTLLPSRRCPPSPRHERSARTRFEVTAWLTGPLSRRIGRDAADEGRVATGPSDGPVGAAIHDTRPCARSDAR